MTRGLRALALSLVAALGLGASPARAAFVTYSATIGQGSPAFSTPFTLTGFDSSKGTLTDITIVTDTSGTASINIINNDGVAHNFHNANAAFVFVVTDPTGHAFMTSATALQSLGTVAPNNSATPAAFSNLAVTGKNGSAVASANFGAFIVSGATPLNFSASIGSGTFGGTQDGGAGNLFFGGTGTVGGTVTITYTFTPAVVPEPASLALTSVGLIGAGGLAARRRRRNRPA